MYSLLPTLIKLELETDLDLHETNISVVAHIIYTDFVHCHLLRYTAEKMAET